MSDAGTYTLRGENRNGSDKVDLDLVVLDTAPDCECEMLKSVQPVLQVCTAKYIKLVLN